MSTLSVQPNERVTYALEYEDESVVVVNKRSGLATQPGLGHEGDTVLNGLFARHGTRLQQLGAARDFGLLHRLDKATSGLLVVALTRAAYDGLREQFENRKIGKFYWAVCSRAPKKPVGMINRPLLEVEPKAGAYGEKKTAKISPRGKQAVTAYRVLSENPRTGAVVEAKPLTGRLHQVRVHLESIGCPIFGDSIYAPTGVARVASRLALHSHRLVFTHPISGERMDIRAACPRDLKTLLSKLDLPRPDVVSKEAHKEIAEDTEVGDVEVSEEE